MAAWAVCDRADRVLEPSCGDAEFLVHAVDALVSHGAHDPAVSRVEIHAESADRARTRVLDTGGRPDIRVRDFFLVDPDGAPKYDVVIGNPPYVRYQQFAGTARAPAQAAAALAGVELTGHASSWAAFTVHAATFIASGGRLAFVVPAELLTVGYAAPVRQFLLDRFASITLVTFDEQVFGDADVDVVLLLADGWNTVPATAITVQHAQNTRSLDGELQSHTWTPTDRAAKWTPALMAPQALDVYSTITDRPEFTVLGSWGKTRLGTVTGNNDFFALTPRKVAELGLGLDVVALSPPKSAHLRGLELSHSGMRELAHNGAKTWLFRPGADPSAAAMSYIAAGEARGVHMAYKCRKRATWWRLAEQRPGDLFITCMNTDTPRITTNSAGVRHLNSVHGVYLHSATRELGRSSLALASLNSVTLLGAEVVGRAYGGGLLKLEPGEARYLPVPAPGLVQSVAAHLATVKDDIEELLESGRLLDAVEVIDRILLVDAMGMSSSAVTELRRERAVLAGRRGAKARAVRGV